LFDSEESMGKLVCFTLTIVGFGAAFLLGLPNIYGSSPGWPLFILILGVITAFGGALISYNAHKYSLIRKEMKQTAIFLFFICFAGSIIIMIFGFLNFYKNTYISIILILIGLSGGFTSAFYIIDLERRRII
jgi:magnesium-transporting ATPase (P-type)